MICRGFLFWLPHPWPLSLLIPRMKRGNYQCIMLHVRTQLRAKGE